MTATAKSDKKEAQRRLLSLLWNAAHYVSILECTVSMGATCFIQNDLRETQLVDYKNNNLNGKLRIGQD